MLRILEAGEPQVQPFNVVSCRAPYLSADLRKSHLKFAWQSVLRILKDPADKSFRNQSELCRRVMVDRAIIAALVTTGLASLLVFAFPGIVILGLFLFILPGLFLGLSPTIFVWLLTFYAAFRLLSLGLKRSLAAIVAALMTFLVMWQIPQSAIADANHSFSAATIDENIFPKERVKLSGDIKLAVPHLRDELLNAEEIERLKADRVAAIKLEAETRPDQCDSDCHRSRQIPSYEDYVDNKRQVAWKCDALCAALLATPGVRSVTIDTHADARKGAPLTEKARTFRLLPKAQCPNDTVKLENPGSLNVQRPKEKVGTGLYQGMSLEAEWNLRLSSTHCVASYPPLTVYDYVIENFEHRQTKFSGDGPYSPAAHISKLLLSDGRGRIILRKNLVHMNIPVAPLLLDTFEDVSEESRIQLATRVRSSGSRHEELNSADLLAKHSNLYVGGVDPALRTSLREQIVKLQADKSIPETDPGFRLLEPWFTSFEAEQAAVSKADIGLIISLIEDRRITEYRGLHWAVKKMGADAVLLRDPIGRRLVGAPPRSKWTKYLSANYTHMLPAEMITTTADEQKILHDQERRLYAGGLILRQADKGADAVPLLLEIMRSHASRLNAGNRKRYLDDDHILPIDAARMAFCQLGGQASSALPEIRRLMARGAISAEKMGDQDWNFMLARIGMPISEIRKPESLSGTEVQYRARIAANLKNFKPERDCQAYWGY